jgi:flagellar biosynthetic protein FliR
VASLAFSDTEINLLVGSFAWPFTRIVGVLLADPIFASSSLPRRFKAGLALVLTVLLAPVLPSAPIVPIVSAQGLTILVQQLLIGLSIGFVMRLTIAAVEMAGLVMAMQMGLGFALFYNPQSGTQEAGVSMLLSMFVYLLFFTFNGPQILLATLADSFHTLPVGLSLPMSGWKLLVEWGGHVVSWGLWMSLPVVGALMVTNLAIAVMTRAAPQFNVFSFGFPLTLLIGFVALYFALPLTVPAVEQVYNDSFQFIEKLLHLPQPKP